MEVWWDWTIGLLVGMNVRIRDLSNKSRVKRENKIAHIAATVDQGEWTTIFVHDKACKKRDKQKYYKDYTVCTHAATNSCQE